MSQMKQLMLSIHILEKRLWIQQAQVDKHTRYFQTLLHRNALMVPALLLPPFYMGWKSGKLLHISLMLKELGKFVLLTLITHIRGL